MSYATSPFLVSFYHLDQQYNSLPQNKFSKFKLCLLSLTLVNKLLLILLRSEMIV